MQVVGTSTPAGDPTAADLFEVVWRSLSDVIGATATASLMRRSARCAIEHGADLEGLVIERQQFRHHYELPDSWAEPGGAGLGALRRLAVELAKVLRTLAGPVLVRRLALDAKLRNAGLFGELVEP